jgi:pimeloyl-ACP methyl ester carboxylesterase
MEAGAGAPTPWSLSRRLEIDGGEIAWDSFGAGPPVVLVHGAPSWSFIWRNVAPELARSFTVYVYDLLGYGDSQASDEREVSIATHGRTVGKLLEHWGLEQPAIAGHDIGGAAVLRAHLLHERSFRRIALVDSVVLAPWVTPTTRHMQAHLDVYATMPSHIFERIVAAHLETAVHGELQQDAYEAYLGRWRGKDGQKRYLLRVAAFDEAHTRELEPLLSTIQPPLLVVWGEQDAWLDPSLARRLAQSVPGAEVRLIPEAGHFVMEDAPAEVARTLLEFFDLGQMP